MISRRLKRSKSQWAEDEADPMETTANLADVMLVFACGLMIAIVSFWNIDLANIEQHIESNGYEDIGHVYTDPETGRTFVVGSGEEEGE